MSDVTPVSQGAQPNFHVTQKSHHSQIRDKPKHSGKVMRTGPRKDGFGKGNTGKPGEGSDDTEELALDPNDPDYEDPRDEIDPEQQKEQ